MKRVLMAVVGALLLRRKERGAAGQDVNANRPFPRRMA